MKERVEQENLRGREFCRACSSTELFVGLDLGVTPIANRLATSAEEQVRQFPLCLMICSVCGLGQVGEYNSRESIFTDYPYLSSTSEVWVTENKRFAHEIHSLLGLGSSDLVLEIASNDGYLLNEFEILGTQTLGIEPAENVAAIARASGVRTISEFFGVTLADEIKKTEGSPRLLVAKNVLAHVPNINDFAAGIARVADESTVVVVETPTILQILDGLQFDTIYHEHFSYLSIESMTRLFETHGLKIVGLELVSTHGGSVRVYATLARSTWTPPAKMIAHLEEMRTLESNFQIKSPLVWRSLAERVNRLLADFRNWLNKREGGVTYAFGAAAKGVTFLTASNIRPGELAGVLDNSVEKTGKYLPGLSIPVLSEADFVSKGEAAPDFLILAWNICDELAIRISTLSPGSRAYIAVPEMRRII